MSGATLKKGIHNPRSVVYDTPSPTVRVRYFGRLLADPGSAIRGLPLLIDALTSLPSLICLRLTIGRLSREDVWIKRRHLLTFT